MKKLLMVSALALALSGCGTTGGIDQGRIDQTIADVQATAARVCSFVPTASTVSAILSALGTPYVGLVTDVAAQICGAIVRRTGAAAPSITVNGKTIAIQGRFVSR